MIENREILLKWKGKLSALLKSCRHVCRMSHVRPGSPGLPLNYRGGNWCCVTCNTAGVSWWAIVYRCLMEQTDRRNPRLLWNLRSSTVKSLKIYDSWIQRQEHKSHYPPYLRTMITNTLPCRQAPKGGGTLSIKNACHCIGGGGEDGKSLKSPHFLQAPRGASHRIMGKTQPQIKWTGLGIQYLPLGIFQHIIHQGMSTSHLEGSYFWVI